MTYKKNNLIDFQRTASKASRESVINKLRLIIIGTKCSPNKFNRRKTKLIIIMFSNLILKLMKLIQHNKENSPRSSLSLRGRPFSPCVSFFSTFYALSFAVSVALLSLFPRTKVPIELCHVCTPQISVKWQHLEWKNKTLTYSVTNHTLLFSHTLHNGRYHKYGLL